MQFFRSGSQWFPCMPMCACDERIFFDENWIYFWSWRIPSANHSPTFCDCLPSRSWYDCIFVVWEILRWVSSKHFPIDLTFYNSFATKLWWLRKRQFSFHFFCFIRRLIFNQIFSGILPIYVFVENHYLISITALALWNK